jgi:uncharacterized membrane protein
VWEIYEFSEGLIDSGRGFRLFMIENNSMNLFSFLPASPQLATGLPTGMQMGGYQPPPGGFPPPPQGGYPPPHGGYPPPQQPYQPSSMPNNVAATLCYALGLITGILFLFLEPYNRDRNIRFHAWQSIFTFGGMFVLQIALSIVGIIATKIFGLLGLLVSLVSLGLSLVTLGLWIFLMVKAYQGEKFSLPIIGPLAEQKA